jgi:hypothetical protein
MRRSRAAGQTRPVFLPLDAAREPTGTLEPSAFAWNRHREERSDVAIQES